MRGLRTGRWLIIMGALIACGAPAGPAEAQSVACPANSLVRDACRQVVGATSGLVDPGALPQLDDGCQIQGCLPDTSGLPQLNDGCQVEACVAAVTALVSGFYDQVCRVAPSRSAASSPTVCGKDADDIAADATDLAAFLTATVGEIVHAVCGIAPAASLSASAAASEPAVCGKTPAEVLQDLEAQIAYLTGRINEVYHQTCGESLTVIARSLTACGITVDEVVEDVNVLASQAQALLYQQVIYVSRLIGGAPSTGSARATQARAQLQLDELDDMIRQLPVCDEEVTLAVGVPLPSQVNQALGVPWPVTPDGCIDESGMLEPPAIPGPRASTLAEKAIALGDAAYCQTGEENDPDDDAEDEANGQTDGHVWTSVRAFGKSPKSYNIGNCHDYTNLAIDKNDFSDGMSGGFVADEVNRCSYIQASHTVSMGATTAPACSSYPQYDEVGQLFNCNSKLDKANKCSNRDGTMVRNDEACHRYFNVRPWLNPTQPQSEAPFLMDNPAKYNGDHRFKWRYITKDGRFVMVKDRGRRSGTGRWIFVNRSCLPDPLPGPNVRPEDVY